MIDKVIFSQQTYDCQNNEKQRPIRQLINTPFEMRLYLSCFWIDLTQGSSHFIA